jgi:hypothetical protein
MPLSELGEKAPAHPLREALEVAYDVRSKVVHGDPPTSVQLGGKTLSPQELAVMMEEDITEGAEKDDPYCCGERGSKVSRRLGGADSEREVVLAGGTLR